MEAVPESNLRWESVQASLRRHVEVLTERIGERSIARLDNLGRSAQYIASAFEDMGLAPVFETYAYGRHTVANVIARVSRSEPTARQYLLGAHYDTVRGTVGADDNASGVAVLLETARALGALDGQIGFGASVTFIAFALEEHPCFWSPYRGSWVHARRARKAGERLDGMICLEMVGTRSLEPGSQRYPFPLMHLNYPSVGDFIGIVGDVRSLPLVHSVRSAFTGNPELPVQTLVVPFRGWLTPFVRRSDHVSFWDMGYPAVMLTDTAEFRNPHYHKRTDTMEKLDYPFMTQLVKSLLSFFLGSAAPIGVRSEP